MPATTKDHNNNENQNNSSDNGKKSLTSTTKPPSEEGLKCPRCDSPNTKFCYYNNYSLTQPRHFCKTCRRYWTKGGALRNVPIGGGCRKNKKGMMKPSPASFSSPSGGSSSSDLLQLGGLNKLLQGLSNPLDFNLGGLTYPASTSSSSRFQQPQIQLPIATGFNNNNQFCSDFGVGSASSSSGVGFQLLDPSSSNSLVGGSSNSNFLGLNNFHGFVPPCSSSESGIFGGATIQQGLNSLNLNSTIASSIESLSSLNQDLHWKLQQQRLSMLFVGDNNENQNQNQNQREDNNNTNIINNSLFFSPVVNNNNNNNNGFDENETVVVQRPQPILFQSLAEISKPLADSEINNNSNNVGLIPSVTTTTTAPTEWFFGNSYGGSVAPTPTSTGSGGNNGHHINNNNNNVNINAGSNNWVAGGFVHAWSDVQQPYSALP